MSDNSPLTSEKIKSVDLFFIVGRSRSGTTLLRTILDSNPTIAIPNECTFILQLSKRYGKIKVWDSKKTSSFITDLQKTWLFANLQIDLTSLTQQLQELITELDYPLLCKTVLLNCSHIAHKKNIQLIGDKNPSYSLHFNELYQIFGTACKYIYINRDYRDQFVSLRNTRFEIPDIVVSTKRWVKAYKSVKKSDCKNIFFVRYEDLVTEPEENLRNICRFLGVDFDPGILDFYKKKESLSVYSNESLMGIHKSITTPLTKNKINLWANELSKNEVAIADRIIGKIAEQCGYERNSKISVLKYFFYSFPGHFIYSVVNVSSCLIKYLPFKLYLKFSGGAYLGNVWNRYRKKK